MGDFDPIALPENYRGTFTLEGIMPGDVVFVYPLYLKQEVNRGGLFLNLNAEIGNDQINPTYFPTDKPSDRVGVVRVYQEVGGEPLDGFVVDITDVKPGSIKTEKLFTVPNQDGVIDEAYLRNQEAQHSQVLGLRYRDAEGEIHYIGPEWFKDAADYIGEVYEAKKAKAAEQPRQDQMPESELLIDKTEPAEEKTEVESSDETAEITAGPEEVTSSGLVLVRNRGNHR